MSLMLIILTYAFHVTPPLAVFPETVFPPKTKLTPTNRVTHDRGIVFHARKTHATLLALTASATTPIMNASY